MTGYEPGSLGEVVLLQAAFSAAAPSCCFMGPHLVFSDSGKGGCEENGELGMERGLEGEVGLFGVV
jgi:hypothetical protein